jgi:hypothetical protein
MMGGGAMDRLELSFITFGSMVPEPRTTISRTVCAFPYLVAVLATIARQ